MLKKSIFLLLAIAGTLAFKFSDNEIPIEFLSMQLPEHTQVYAKTVLENEITGITVDHITISGNSFKEEEMDEQHRTFSCLSREMEQYKQRIKAMKSYRKRFSCPMRLRRLP